MRLLHVLVDDSGTVLGTADTETTSNDGAPTAHLVAGPGQRIVDVQMDDDMAGLAPDDMHEALRARL
jgi:hypothetical protein